jgi:hypothetical protein
VVTIFFFFLSLALLLILEVVFQIAVSFDLSQLGCIIRLFCMISLICLIYIESNTLAEDEEFSAPFMVMIRIQDSNRRVQFSGQAPSQLL